MPELALEVVSNKIGGEDTEKKQRYAELGIKYYVIYDPYQYLSEKELRVYELKANEKYVLVQRKHNFMPLVNLGIKLWTGLYEGEGDTWARWCDKNGVFLKTGSEQAEIERAEKEKEKERAEKEKVEKEIERERADREKAEKEKERAEKEIERAEKEKEKQRADEEKRRADEAEELLSQLKAQLEALKLNQE
ncbi:MAG: Uma2 family endonuclease [Microscillaceae bacterium]|nr:Uma2 family endonuclease [Microscillaceae bacterium]